MKGDARPRMRRISCNDDSEIMKQIQEQKNSMQEAKRDEAIVHIID